MKKLLRVSCLFWGISLALCACASAPQENPSSSDSGDMPQSVSPPSQPNTPPSSPPSEQPLEIGADRVPVSDTAARLDLRYFEEKNLTLDSVYACKDGNVLFFFSPVSPDGTLKENIQVYSYRTKSGTFSFEHFDAGPIGFYPSAVYEDGTVSVVTLNSETYDYKSIVFIHPDTLEREAVPVSWDGSVMNVSISPDKKLVAVTTYDGLSVCKLTGEQLYALPRRAGSSPDGENDMLPYGGAWAPDGSALAVRYIGWEHVYYPALLHTGGWSLTEYPQLADAILSYLPNGKTVYSTWYSFLPCGLLSSSGEPAPFTFQDPRLSSEEPADFAFSSDGELAAATLPNRDGTCAVVAAWTGSGETAAELTLTLGEGDTRFFEQAAFAPDTHLLLLVTSTTDRDDRQVYIVDIPSKP